MRGTAILSLKHILYIIAFGLIAVIMLAVTGCGLFTDCGSNNDAELSDCRETLTQICTIDALLMGFYDGVVDCGQLKEYGDFGIGTFEALDGEMVVLDGTVYQVKHDGTVAQPENSVGVPFASITHFEPDLQIDLTGEFNFESLEVELDDLISSDNIFCAVKVEGDFDYIKTRSVAAQEKPYPPLAEVTGNQSIFEFENISGTIVGFYCPEYVSGINVPGYHLHFLSEDKQSGGHLLALEAENLAVEIDETSGLYMILPEEDSGFYQLNLTEDQSETLEQVEK
jgi:acetolactate decarboxylase